MTTSRRSAAPRRLLVAALDGAAMAVAASLPACSGPTADDIADVSAARGAPPAAAVATLPDDDPTAPREVIDLSASGGCRVLRGGGAATELVVRGPRVVEIAADGRETVVGMTVSDVRTSNPGHLPPEEAFALAARDLAALRGIAFAGWRPEFGALLERVDGTRCIVRIGIGAHGATPRLPRHLRSLSILGSPLRPSLDLGPLAHLAELRYLEVQGVVQDWAPLGGMHALRRLRAEVLPEAAATMPVLPRLERFDSARETSVSDIVFVSRFPALRVLNVSGTGVTDLSPIARLSAIERVWAFCAQVNRVPTVAVPSLRELQILPNAVPAAEMQAFLAANPQCAAAHSLRSALDIELVGVDGLRVRTGGQCHRDTAGERTVFATQERAAIEELLALLEIDEIASRSGRCLCCGGPTLELTRGGSLAVALSVHHGTRLRWLDGWPDDGHLTEESASALASWLERLGVVLDDR